MTSTVIAAIVLTLIAGVLFALRRLTHRGRSFDLGAVSTGWLADLRRDEPWSSNL